MSLHTVWLAAVALLVLGVAVDGPAALGTLDAADLLAACTLAVVVTASAFVLWYSAVARIGAARAGLFTGFAPVAAAVGGVLLGGQIPALSGQASRWSLSGWYWGSALRTSRYVPACETPNAQRPVVSAARDGVVRAPGRAAR